MTTGHDPATRFVLSWLREDAHENAERVLLRALDEVDTTPQRRSWWPARRSSEMNRFSFLAIAAAAIVAVAFVGYNILPLAGPGGTSPPTAATIPPPGASPTGPPRLPAGSLAPGAYSVDPFPLASDADLAFTLTVPSGWQGVFNGVVANAGTEAPGGAIVFLLPTELFVDPCENAPGSPVISAGTTVDDLVNAFAEVRAPERDSPAPYAVGTAVAVTIDGYAGQRIEVIVPSNLDFATCDDGQFWVWDAGPYAQGPGNHWHIWILDVAGTRVVILGEDFPTTPAAVHRELQAIVASIRINPTS